MKMVQDIIIAPVITEASILVTYVALGAAVLTAIFTEIYKAFK